ncbi:uncharacterized protein [Dysidea avara]|uniref:uncharacterized protein n=1 Tax=Dysidea avara TaxID=196820 RepID=UPI00331EEFED
MSGVNFMSLLDRMTNLKGKPHNNCGRVSTRTMDVTTNSVSLIAVQSTPTTTTFITSTYVSSITVQSNTAIDQSNLVLLLEPTNMISEDGIISSLNSMLISEQIHSTVALTSEIVTSSTSLTLPSSSIAFIATSTGVRHSTRVHEQMTITPTNITLSVSIESLSSMITSSLLSSPSSPVIINTSVVPTTHNVTSSVSLSSASPLVQVITIDHVSSSVVTTSSHLSSSPVPSTSPWDTVLSLTDTNASIIPNATLSSSTLDQSNSSSATGVISTSTTQLSSHGSILRSTIPSSLLPIESSLASSVLVHEIFHITPSGSETMSVATDINSPVTTQDPIMNTQSSGILTSFHAGSATVLFNPGTVVPVPSMSFLSMLSQSSSIGTSISTATVFPQESVHERTYLVDNTPSLSHISNELQETSLSLLTVHQLNTFQISSSILSVSSTTVVIEPTLTPASSTDELISAIRSSNTTTTIITSSPSTVIPVVNDYVSVSILSSPTIMSTTTSPVTSIISSVMDFITFTSIIVSEPATSSLDSIPLSSIPTSTIRSFTVDMLNSPTYHLTAVTPVTHFSNVTSSSRTEVTITTPPTIVISPSLTFFSSSMINSVLTSTVLLLLETSIITASETASLHLGTDTQSSSSLSILAPISQLEVTSVSYYVSSMSSVITSMVTESNFELMPEPTATLPHEDITTFETEINSVSVHFNSETIITSTISVNVPSSLVQPITGAPTITISADSPLTPGVVNDSSAVVLSTAMLSSVNIGALSSVITLSTQTTSSPNSSSSVISTSIVTALNGVTSLILIDTTSQLFQPLSTISTDYISTLFDSIQVPTVFTNSSSLSPLNTESAVTNLNATGIRIAPASTTILESLSLISDHHPLSSRTVLIYTSVPEQSTFLTTVTTSLSYVESTSTNSLPSTNSILESATSLLSSSNHVISTISQIISSPVLSTMSRIVSLGTNSVVMYDSASTRDPVFQISSPVPELSSTTAVIAPTPTSSANELIRSSNTTTIIITSSPSTVIPVVDDSVNVSILSSPTIITTPLSVEMSTTTSPVTSITSVMDFFTYASIIISEPATSSLDSILMSTTPTSTIRSFTVDTLNSPTSHFTLVTPVTHLLSVTGSSRTEVTIATPTTIAINPSLSFRNSSMINSVPTSTTLLLETSTITSATALHEDMATFGMEISSVSMAVSEIIASTVSVNLLSSPFQPSSSSSTRASTIIFIVHPSTVLGIVTDSSVASSSEMISNVNIGVLTSIVALSTSKTSSPTFTSLPPVMISTSIVTALDNVTSVILPDITSQLVQPSSTLLIDYVSTLMLRDSLQVPTVSTASLSLTSELADRNLSATGIRIAPSTTIPKTPSLSTNQSSSGITVVTSTSLPDLSSLDYIVTSVVVASLYVESSSTSSVPTTYQLSTTTSSVIGGVTTDSLLSLSRSFTSIAQDSYTLLQTTSFNLEDDSTAVSTTPETSISMNLTIFQSVLSETNSIYSTGTVLPIVPLPVVTYDSTSARNPVYQISSPVPSEYEISSTTAVITLKPTSSTDELIRSSNTTTTIITSSPSTVIPVVDDSVSDSILSSPTIITTPLSVEMSTINAPVASITSSVMDFITSTSIIVSEPATSTLDSILTSSTPTSTVMSFTVDTLNSPTSHFTVVTPVTHLLSVTSSSRTEVTIITPTTTVINPSLTIHDGSMINSVPTNTTSLLEASVTSESIASLYLEAVTTAHTDSSSSSSIVAFPESQSEVTTAPHYFSNVATGLIPESSLPEISATVLHEDITTVINSVSMAAEFISETIAPTLSVNLPSSLVQSRMSSITFLVNPSHISGIVPDLSVVLSSVMLSSVDVETVSMSMTSSSPSFATSAPSTIIQKTPPLSTDRSSSGITVVASTSLPDLSSLDYIVTSVIVMSLSDVESSSTSSVPTTHQLSTTTSSVIGGVITDNLLSLSQSFTTVAQDSYTLLQTTSFNLEDDSTAVLTTPETSLSMNLTNFQSILSETDSIYSTGTVLPIVPLTTSSVVMYDITSARNPVYQISSPVPSEYEIGSTIAVILPTPTSTTDELIRSSNTTTTIITSSLSTVIPVVNDSVSVSILSSPTIITTPLSVEMSITTLPVTSITSVMDFITYASIIVSEPTTSSLDSILTSTTPTSTIRSFTVDTLNSPTSHFTLVTPVAHLLSVTSSSRTEVTIVTPTTIAINPSLSFHNSSMINSVPTSTASLLQTSAITSATAPHEDMATFGMEISSVSMAVDFVSEIIASTVSVNLPSSSFQPSSSSSSTKASTITFIVHPSTVLGIVTDSSVASSSEMISNVNIGALTSIVALSTSKTSSPTFTLLPPVMISTSIVTALDNVTSVILPDITSQLVQPSSTLLIDYTSILTLRDSLQVPTASLSLTSELADRNVSATGIKIAPSTTIPKTPSLSTNQSSSGITVVASINIPNLSSLDYIVTSVVVTSLSHVESSSTSSVPITYQLSTTTSSVIGGVTTDNLLSLSQSFTTVAQDSYTLLQTTSFNLEDDSTAVLTTPETSISMNLTILQSVLSETNSIYSTGAVLPIVPLSTSPVVMYDSTSARNPVYQISSPVPSEYEISSTTAVIVPTPTSSTDELIRSSNTTTIIITSSPSTVIPVVNDSVNVSILSSPTIITTTLSVEMSTTTSPVTSIISVMDFITSISIIVSEPATSSLDSILMSTTPTSTIRSFTVDTLNSPTSHFTLVTPVTHLLSVTSSSRTEVTITTPTTIAISPSLTIHDSSMINSVPTNTTSLLEASVTSESIASLYLEAITTAHTDSSSSSSIVAFPESQSEVATTPHYVSNI